MESLMNRTYECIRNPEPDWPSNQWLVIVREGDEVVDRFHCEDGPRWVANEKLAIEEFVEPSARYRPPRTVSDS